MTFYEFIMKQDPHRKIDHSAGWECCAVGEYFDEIGENLPEYVVAEEYPDLFKGTEDLVEQLNGRFGENYGHLQEFIR